MKSRHSFLIFLMLTFLAPHLAHAQDMDAAISKLTEDVAARIKANGSKKVTVLDFTDLQSEATELGRYLAEQLTVDFVMTNRDFSVLDRAHLKKILAEHQLTSTGLVDPENAKKLGMFAGVDAMIFGTAVAVGTNISVTVKVITTEAAEVVGGAKTKFKYDETLKQLLSKPAKSTDTSDSEKGPAGPLKTALLAKTFGALTVEVVSLRIINDGEYLLSIALTNNHPTRSLRIALDANTGTMGSLLKSVLIDPGGFEFNAEEGDVTGLAAGEMLPYFGYRGGSTEIRPNEMLSVAIRFLSRRGRKPSQGTCHLQLGILALSFNSYGTVANTGNVSLIGDIKAN